MTTGTTQAPAGAPVRSEALLAVVPGVEYYWKRTTGWQWDGEERWWEIFIVFHDGMNGGGGACVREIWRWNKSLQDMRVQPRNLTYAETIELLRELTAIKE